jgi:molybdate transport system substrate-binding protein
LAMVLLVAVVFGCRVERGPAAGAAGSKAGGKQQVSIYVPCGMLLPFNDALKQFEKENPGVKVAATYENSGTLVRMITDKGERPDLFVSPGCCEAQVLETRGLVKKEDTRTLGSYEVVLIVPKGNPAGVRSWEDLRKPSVKTISVADPDWNSIGHYARQGLTKMGIWDSIKGKMLRTEHAVDAYTNVSQGKAEAAFSYLTCPITSNPEKLSSEKVDIVTKLPPDTYDVPTVVIAMLDTSKNKPLARKIMEYLLEPEVQALLEREGLPNERKAATPGVPEPTAGRGT